MSWRSTQSACPLVSCKKPRIRFFTTASSTHPSAVSVELTFSFHSCVTAHSLPVPSSWGGLTRLPVWTVTSYSLRPHVRQVRSALTSYNAHFTHGLFFAFAPPDLGTGNGAALSMESDKLLWAESAESGGLPAVPLPLCASHTALRRRFGPGIQLYLQVALLQAAALAMLSVWICAQWFSFVPLLAAPFDYNDMFVSEYPESMGSIWFFTNSATVVLSFAVPVFGVLFGRYFVGSKRDDWKREENALPEAAASDRVFLRRIGSVVLCSVVLGAGVAAVFGITVGELALIQAWRRREIARLSRTWIATICNLLSSGFLVIWGVAVMPLSEALTRAEKWGTWTRYHLSLSAKLIGFRVLLLVASFVFTASLSEVRLTESCILWDMGAKLLAMLLCDFVGVNAFTIGAALLVPALRRRFECCRGNRDSSDDCRMEFHVSMAILEMMYRSLLILLGSLVCPLISLVGLLFVLLQYVIDRVLILRLTRKSAQHHLSRKFFWAMLLGVAIVFLLMYPQGPMWLLYFPHPFLPRAYRNCSMYDAVSKAL